jgi:hypothetical protein
MMGVSLSSFCWAWASFFFSSTHVSSTEIWNQTNFLGAHTLRVCSQMVLIMNGIAKSIKFARQPNSMTTSGFTSSEQLHLA